jgi:hypothetical protein
MGGRHVKTQMPIVLGGRADVKCISSMWRPAGVGSGVVIDNSWEYQQHVGNMLVMCQTVANFGLD